MNFTNYCEFELHKEKCRDCCVGNIYNKVVLSDGNKVNPIVIIQGECPGKDEVDLGKPFVGKCGQVLRAILNKFGFTKNNSLITNTLPCRPENNKFPADEKLVRTCMDKWLLKEIELLKPKYLLLIGATPTKYVLNLAGITKIRGQWFEFKNIPAMPTLHPSYVLRKQYMAEGKEIREQFELDIKNVAEKAGFIK